MAEGDDLEAALVRLGRDGLVAFPTETVWGLGARALSQAAVAQLRRWKGRAQAQPVSLLVDGSVGLEEYGFALSPLARLLMERFWPGPVTFVLPCTGRFAAGIGREDGAVGLRCSTHPAAAALARGARARGIGPITATSLNRSGEPPARTRDQALSLCAATAGEDTPGPLVRAGEVFCFAPAGCDAGGEAPSSVIDLTGAEPRVLREGPGARDILAAARAAAD